MSYGGGMSFLDHYDPHQAKEASAPAKLPQQRRSRFRRVLGAAGWTAALTLCFGPLGFAASVPQLGRAMRQEVPHV